MSTATDTCVSPTVSITRQHSLISSVSSSIVSSTYIKNPTWMTPPSPYHGMKAIYPMTLDFCFSFQGERHQIAELINPFTPDSAYSKNDIFSRITNSTAVNTVMYLLCFTQHPIWRVSTCFIQVDHVIHRGSQGSVLR